MKTSQLGQLINSQVIRFLRLASKPRRILKVMVARYLQHSTSYRNAFSSKKTDQIFYRTCKFSVQVFSRDVRVIWFRGCLAKNLQSEIVIALTTTKFSKSSKPHLLECKISSNLKKVARPLLMAIHIFACP